MNNSLVSVIMPAYNAGEFITESIESVIEQTYNNWELLVVDDGSTDNTKELIHNFCLADKRIKYFWQQNGKQGKARNLALANAKGGYIAFIDADDVWLPEKLSVQLKQVEEKKADLVFSEGYLFTNSLLDSASYMNTGKGFFSGNKGVKDFLEINKIFPSSVLAKAEIIHRVNGFTEEPSIQNAEDYHLWLQLLLNGYTFYGSERVLAGYRIHPNSVSYIDKLSLAKSIEMIEDLKKSYKSHKKTLNAFHKIWFRRYHYSTNNWSRYDYKDLIKKNCSYVFTPASNIFFQTIYTLFGFNITRRLINKVINNYKL